MRLPALLTIIVGIIGATAIPQVAQTASAAVQDAAAPAPPLRLTLTSSAFSEYGTLPLKYAPNAATMATFNATSPPVAWTNVPPGTRSFTLTMQDLESSTGGSPKDGLVWMVVNIKTGVNRLPEGVPRGRTSVLPEGAFQRSFLTNGYIGPQPGANVSSHHYLFHLYPLDTRLNVPDDVTFEQLMTAMDGHVTGRKATLIVTCCAESK